MIVAYWVATLAASTILMAFFLSAYLTNTHRDRIRELERELVQAHQERKAWKQWVYECEERITKMLKERDNNEERDDNE